MKRKTLNLLGRVLRLFIVALVTGLALGAGPTSIARAVSITVDSTADAVDAAPGNGVCATAGGDCTLRAAIQEANALPGDDTIVLPAGAYTLTIVGAEEMYAATGDLDIRENLTITGAGAAMTVINGNGGVTGDRVFEIRSGNAAITGVTIQNGNPGSGAIGGAIYNMRTLAITDSIIAGNSAGNGGAIYNDDTGTLTLINSTVTGNTTTLGLGAIYNRGTLTVTHSAVSGNNTTGSGGGIWTEIGTLTLMNSTVSGNSATSVGGGILVASGSTVNMNNVTITNNTAGNGGGGIINSGGTVNFKNTLIAGNSSTFGGADCAGTLTSQGYNLIQSTASCTIAGDTTGNITGQNPILGPLQDNGGSALTHAPLPGSPAINAANPAAPGSGGNACEASDQRGVTRPQGARCDVGAVEIYFRLYLPVILKSSPLSTATYSAGASGATYYVRPDGGSSMQCTGLADAAYPGSGTGQPCAWDHPFRALPPGGAPRISGGDTLIVGAGSYRMGYGAPGADTCDAAGAYGCHMPPIPSGPSPANPTRILGAGWNSGCASPPELWGAERPWFIVNMTDSSNVELACLEITDHSGCVEFHSGGLACERDTPPYGDWASYGLYAEDSANVYLHDLNIHGLAAGGVHVGRLIDWTVEDVRIAGNGSVGWDGDLWDALGDSNSGTLTFRRWTVEWNGCGETYPGEQPTGCWAQSAGGYGDGFATGESGGHWIVEDSVIRYNTSDGLDFLYIRELGSSITIRRTLAEGNAGNQIKNFRGPFLLENSIVVGNCGFFNGQPFTHNVDNCRAMGDALDLGLTAGDHVTVTNNTLTSEGDCLVGAEFYGASSTGAERVTLRNNIFVGQTDFLQPFENTCLAYQETFPANPFDIDYSVITGTKDTPPCPGAHDQCGVAPGLVSTAIDSFNAHFVTGSPTINAGTSSGAPLDDFDGRLRDALPDVGAYEWRPTAAWVYLPAIRR